MDGAPSVPSLVGLNSAKMKMQCLVALRSAVARVASCLPRLLATTTLAAVAISAFGVERLQLSAGPLFLGGNPSTGLTIDVENSGPDARGVIQVNAAGGTTFYPIELPRGAHKKLTGYPLTNNNGYDTITCDLQTDRGSVEYEVPFGSYDDTRKPLEITEDLGGLQFLKPHANAGGYRTTAASPVLYVKPEDAPGRLLAYRTLTYVVLGPGAERISDDAVHALIEYVLGGGVLIFNGGEVSAPMHDPRWSAVLPLLNAHASTQEVSLHIGNYGFRQVLGVQLGDAIAGSSRSLAGIIRNSYGMGQILVLPFDILEGPLKVWNGREDYFNSLVSMPTGRLIMWPSLGANEPMMGSYASGGYVAYGPGGTVKKDDPFSFQPPQPESVALLILCYLILVAPVNFLILRKLKKSEWAWFTSPAISFVFAIFILKLASGLYFGKMMTAVNGSLVTDEGSPLGIFRGSSQLFFPAGGSYDLELANVDWLSTAPDYGFRTRPNQADSITAVDTGQQMLVPNLSTRNLQFKDVDFEQIIDTKGWFNFSIVRTKDDVKITITNHSNYMLKGGSISAEGAEAPLFGRGAGKSATVTVPVDSSKVSGDSVSGYSQLIHRAILTGYLIGFRPGPQIGTEVRDRNSVRIAVVSKSSTNRGESGE
jgi:hypothetical protein